MEYSRGYFEESIANKSTNTALALAKLILNWDVIQLVPASLY